MSELYFKHELMNSLDLNRALVRISHEIIEKNKGCEDLVLVGIKTRGVPMAKKIAANISKFENVNVPVDFIDITLYRDDLSEIADYPTVNNDNFSLDIHNKNVILIDDVIYTGRTARAAIEAILKIGRPKTIQLAVLIDRGHKELPIHADYVGKNIPTSLAEVVQVKFIETDGQEKVDLLGL